MGDHFSFKWTDFRSSLTQGFHDFLQEEMMVDVTLAAEGKFIQAHKLVLSVCSPYFKTLFKVNPCKHPIVILQDIGHSELSSMLEFMYRGEVGVRHESLKSFLKLADTLKVKGLEGKNFQVDKCSYKMAKVKKKFDKDEAFSSKNFSQSLNEESEKNVLKKRKRRLTKLDSVKKFKSETSENIGENISKENKSLCVSEDEDDNPLISLIKSEKVKSGDSSKHSESDIQNKMSFSDWNDGVATSDYSRSAEDFETLFSNVHAEDSEQTPQGPWPVKRVAADNSPLWKYLVKGLEGRVQCISCGKILKFIPKKSNPSNLVRHLKLHEDLFNAYRAEKFGSIW